mmetsp:Transcript_1648/g.4357  ORF Transcript_1648/g.4357 Transcript_1648/m.4357 type:complete len:262 (-) Transcript_1648:1170-1955(-)
MTIAHARLAKPIMFEFSSPMMLAPPTALPPPSSDGSTRSAMRMPWYSRLVSMSAMPSSRNVTCAAEQPVNWLRSSATNTTSGKPALFASILATSRLSLCSVRNADVIQYSTYSLVPLSLTARRGPRSLSSRTRERSTPQSSNAALTRAFIVLLSDLLPPAASPPAGRDTMAAVCGATNRLASLKLSTIVRYDTASSESIIRRSLMCTATSNALRGSRLYSISLCTQKLRSLVKLRPCVIISRWISFQRASCVSPCSHWCNE